MAQRKPTKAVPTFVRATFARLPLSQRTTQFHSRRRGRRRVLVTSSLSSSRSGRRCRRRLRSRRLRSTSHRRCFLRAVVVAVVNEILVVNGMAPDHSTKNSLEPI